MHFIVSSSTGERIYTVVVVSGRAVTEPTLLSYLYRQQPSAPTQTPQYIGPWVVTLSTDIWFRTCISLLRTSRSSRIHPNSFSLGTTDSGGTQISQQTFIGQYEQRMAIFYTDIKNEFLCYQNLNPPTRAITSSGSTSALTLRSFGTFSP